MRLLLAGRVALEADVEEQVFLHRQVLVEHVELRAESKALLQVLHVASDFEATKDSAASRRVVQADEHVDHGGLGGVSGGRRETRQENLARAVGAEQAEALALVEVEVDAVHGPGLPVPAEALGETLDDQGRLIGLERAGLNEGTLSRNVLVLVLSGGRGGGRVS